MGEKHWSNNKTGKSSRHQQKSRRSTRNRHGLPHDSAATSTTDQSTTGIDRTGDAEDYRPTRDRQSNLCGQRRTPIHSPIDRSRRAREAGWLSIQRTDCQPGHANTPNHSPTDPPGIDGQGKPESYRSKGPTAIPGGSRMCERLPSTDLSTTRADWTVETETSYRRKADC